MVRAVTLYQGPQSYAGCGIYVLVRSPVVAGLREAYSLHWRRHPHEFLFLFRFFYSLLSTKRPPMLWGSTCRAVTSFRPYDLVDRPSDAYIRQPNAYAYRPIDRPFDDRPYVSIGRLHRTAT